MSSGFQFIEQPLFIKNCGPATTIPMVIHTDSGTYEGFRLEMIYLSQGFDTVRQKTISLDNYEYGDTKVQKIKGFFENDMWTGTSGNTLHVELWNYNDTELIMMDDIEVVEEEWTLRESLENAYNELHTFLKDLEEQHLVYYLADVNGFGSLINKVDEYMACKIIENPDQYSGHPSKDLDFTHLLLKNTSSSQPLLHREFTKKTNYRLDFTFQTSVDNKTGFMYGFEPDLPSGTTLSTSSGAHGLHIVTRQGNTYIETFDNGSPILLYTHTSNLFSPGGSDFSYHVSIYRNGMTAEIYINKQLIYRYDNIKYNTIGLNKWGSGYNQISDIQLSIDPE